MKHWFAFLFIFLGTAQAKVVAIKSSTYHTCALNDQGQLKCWGVGSSGELGNESTQDIGDSPGEMGENLLSINFGEGFKVEKFFVGDRKTCVIGKKPNEKLPKLTCIGENHDGELGLGHKNDIGNDEGEMGEGLEFLKLGNDVPVLAQPSSQHTCILLNTGFVKCVGMNGSGRLGHPGTTYLNLPQEAPVDLGSEFKVASLSTGWEHNCALSISGKVKCWGNGLQGQLGYEKPTSLGRKSSDLGDNLKELDFGVESPALSVVSGSNHNCALFDGFIKCWGENRRGQLGLGDTLNRGDQPGQMGKSLSILDLGENSPIVRIAAGAHHSCAVFKNGLAKCWGSNTSGQLGVGNIVDQGSSKDHMGNNLKILGLPKYRKVIDLSAGHSFTCALTEFAARREIYCFGHNQWGQLGLEDDRNRGDNSSTIDVFAEPVDLGDF